MSRLDQSVAARLAEMADVFSSGQTALTGKAKRVESGEVIGRFRGGSKKLYPELEHFSESPSQIAEAIRKHHGPLWERIQVAAHDYLSTYVTEPKRWPGKPTIPPHTALNSRCKVLWRMAFDRSASLSWQGQFSNHALISFSSQYDGR